MEWVLEDYSLQYSQICTKNYKQGAILKTSKQHLSSILEFEIHVLHTIKMNFINVCIQYLA